MMKVSKVVNDAMVNGVNVEFVYANRGRNTVGVRRVQPVEFIIGGNVLVGIDLDKDDYRRFSLDGMSDVHEVS